MSIVLNTEPRQPIRLFIVQVNCFFPISDIILHFLPVVFTTSPLLSPTHPNCVISLHLLCCFFPPLMVLPPPPFSIYVEGQAGKSGVVKRQEAQQPTCHSFLRSCLLFSVMAQESISIFELKQPTGAGFLLIFPLQLVVAAMSIHSCCSGCRTEKDDEVGFLVVVLRRFDVPFVRLRTVKPPQNNQPLQEIQRCHQKVLSCPFYGMRTMFIRLFVNPEPTLCSINKGEAVLLHLSSCVALGGV